MDEPGTCGQGLAEHSVLPAKLGELMAAVGLILESHRKTLDLADENARTEDAAYRGLADEHRKAAVHLQSIARRMAGYRHLPMGRHDPAAMASREVVRAFEAFVTRERELLALLQRRVERDERMLAAMRGRG